MSEERERSDELTATRMAVLKAANEQLRQELRERRNVEARLRESEQLYRLLFNEMLNGFALHEIICGADGKPCDYRFLQVNPAFERLTGLNAEDVVDQTVRDVLPGIEQHWIEFYGKVALTGEPIHFESYTKVLDRYYEIVAFRPAEGQFATIFTDVTERKQVEEALRESEARYRHLFEQAHDSVFIVDPRTRCILDVNENAFRRLGYTREELLALQIDDVDIPADQSNNDAVIAAVQASGGMVFEQEHRRKDGSIMPVELSARVVELAGRKVFQSNARDITKRREAEEALRESEERFRGVFENAVDAIFIHDLEGHIRGVNQRACESLGYSRKELLELSFHEIDAELTAQQSREMWAELSRSKTLVFESRLCRKDGGSFPVEAHVGLFEQRGESLVMDLVRDISERKVAEAAMRKLSAAVEHNPNAVVITDAEGHIEYVNPAFTAISGYQPEEVIGHNPRFLKSGQVLPELYEALWSTITAGEVWRGEVCNRKKSGDLFWALLSISSIKDDEGLISHYIGIQEDITEHKRIEEELAQAQRMEVVGQLTGGIAHDFNNLLTVVLGNLELLSIHLRGDERHHKLAEAGLRAAQRGSELTHRLLAFSRKQPLRPAVIEVDPLVAEILELLQRTLGESIEIETVLEEGVSPIYADSGQVQNALLNLALNARDAMPVGGKLTMEVRGVDLDERYAVRQPPVQPGDFVLIEVRDTGCGMSQEVAQRAVEPFFTTKGMATHSGLGLSMVYGFAKQSGGHVEIETEEGVGTRVKLVLPRAEVPQKPVTVSEAAHGEIPGGDETILVVEDESSVRKLTTALLSSLGYKVLGARDGPTALATLGEAPRVDLLFSDVVMPGGLSGYDVARLARHRHPGLKVILTSGYSAEQIGEQPDAEYTFITKPYRRLDLARKVREVLEG
ncbi:MAG: PAS domain S-box protein [bacterium]|nr:PAS domain S-box protein [bacterium]